MKAKLYVCTSIDRRDGSATEPKLVVARSLTDAAINAGIESDANHVPFVRELSVEPMVVELVAHVQLDQ